jgi:hypothetical protein
MNPINYNFDQRIPRIRAAMALKKADGSIEQSLVDHEPALQNAIRLIGQNKTTKANKQITTLESALRDFMDGVNRSPQKRQRIRRGNKDLQKSINSILFVQFSIIYIKIIWTASWVYTHHTCPINFLLIVFAVWKK